MTDRLLSHCLWLIVMTLIVASVLGALVLLYSGLFSLITRQFETGIGATGAGLALAAAAFKLCKHSEDLMDRRLG